MNQPTESYRFSPVPLSLSRGQTVTSLYQSPFDFDLLNIICLAKTGLKVRVVVDDIDNMGVDKLNPSANYVYADKYFLSKTARSNLRPLTLTCPKNFFANLAIPALKELDQQSGIFKLKTNLMYAGTVEHWIRDITREFGLFSFIGPDKAFAFRNIDEAFVQGIKNAQSHILKIIAQFKTREKHATEFINWLFDDLHIGENISNYYCKILNKLIERFNLAGSVFVEKTSQPRFEKKTVELYRQLQADAQLQNVYREAILLDGHKSADDIPFYSISKSSGDRLLPAENYFKNPDEYFLAPKVFMLNNFENLILPYNAMFNPHIHSREILYNSGKVKCNQIFCDDQWFEHIMHFKEKIHLSHKEADIYGLDVLEFDDLKSLKSQPKQSGDNYRDWIINSTVRAIDQAKYPLIFLALFRDEIFYTDIPQFYSLKENAISDRETC